MISRLQWMAPAALLLFTACGGSESAADYSSGETAANPCAAAMASNPCAAGGMQDELPVDAIRQAGRALDAHGNTEPQLVAMGQALWSDPSLSGTGVTSCSTCHTGGGTALMNPTFAQPYPHEVAMARERAGLEMVTAAEMVQLCMAIPMNADPFDYGAVELAALAAFVTDLQASTSSSSTANPCAAGMNPCAAAMNPCGGR